MTTSDLVLTSLLIGKFARHSLRETLTGMTIRDISGVEMMEFVACLPQKDRLLGMRLWAEVFLPIRNAWQTWREIAPAHDAALRQYTRTIASVQERLTGDGS